MRFSRDWHRHPAFLVLALVVGVGLLFGAPLLLAQNDHTDHGTATRSESEEHGAAGEEAHSGEHGAAEVVIGADGETGEHYGEEGSAHGEGGGFAHPPTLISILADVIEGHSVHEAAEAKNPVARFLLIYKAPIYSLIIIGILAAIFIAGSRRMTMVPGPLQNLVEWAVESLDNFIRGVIGPEGPRFVPFLGTLFIYIYLQNIFGLFPLMFTPTSMVETTAAMGILVFLYVQWVGITSNGPLGYLKHLAGDPQDAVGWAMAPLQFPLHVVGELAKPLSLSLRLFGNMMGEETLLAVFMGLGVALLAATHLPLGIPLHVPFIFLALLTTFIQALVFTLLSTIYFALVLPHHEEEH